MNISQSQLLINKSRIRRRITKKKKADNRCYHCSGAFKGTDELENCLMCGREKGHVCANCLHAPEGKLDQEKKSA